MPRYRRTETENQCSLDLSTWRRLRKPSTPRYPSMTVITEPRRDTVHHEIGGETPCDLSHMTNKKPLRPLFVAGPSTLIGRLRPRSSTMPLSRRHRRIRVSVSKNRSGGVNATLQRLFDEVSTKTALRWDDRERGEETFGEVPYST